MQRRRHSGPGKDHHGQEFRGPAAGQQREHGYHPEVVGRGVEGRPGDRGRNGRLFEEGFEDGTAALEKLFGVKSLDKAIEVQTEYAKTAYEGFVAKATKIGELYADLAKETYKPFETMMAKAK